VGTAHWDEVEKQRRERGPMAGTWTNLGRAAGSSRCGVSRIELAPGEQPTPVHLHGDAEEIFYVLGGSGVTWTNEKTYPIGAGDCIVYQPYEHAHTLRAGDDGLDVLAFGAREYMRTSSLPRSGLMWGIAGVIEEKDFDQFHPWDREPPIEWPEPEHERPSTIVNVADVEADVHEGRRRRDLGRAVGSNWTGFKYIETPAGTLSVVPHVHSAEEELFVVLDGDGSLELYTSDAQLAETHEVRRGSVVARPPGTGIAHTFRAGDGGLTLLAWGTRDPNDITGYPRSKKLFWRGVGVIGRVETLDFWDGESLT
jgi:uncharacterized cupin superfamily protein